MSCLLMTTLVVLVALVGAMACFFAWIALWFHIADGKTWGLIVVLAPVFIGSSVGIAMGICGAAP